MLTVIFLTSSDGSEGINFEHIMRIRFLAQNTELIMLTGKGADFSRYVNDQVKIYPSFFPGKAGLLLNGFLWILRRRKKLSNVIIITEPSIVGALGYLCRKISNAKWVVDVWDIPFRYIGANLILRLKNTITKKIFRRLYRQADLFVVGIRPDMGFRYFQIPETKIVAMPTTINIPENIVNPDSPGKRNSFKIFCMKSCHKDYMGLDVLDIAFKKVLEEAKNAELYIVGNVDGEVEAQIGFLRQSSNVHFTGFMEHEKLMELMKQVSVCVIPWQNVEDLGQLYPTKVMEYMTEGKAVIASKVPGVADMIENGYNGFLVNPGDPEDLASKILELYRNRELLNMISKNAAIYNERFDGKVKNMKIYSLLEKMVDNRQDFQVCQCQSTMS